MTNPHIKNTVTSMKVEINKGRMNLKYKNYRKM